MTSTNKIMIACLGAIALLCLIMGKNNSGVAVKKEVDEATADTLIPSGFVLVPIEMVNVAAIAGLIDRFGVVDLYAGESLVASRIKILRAPLNPNQYAAMVTEEVSRELMRHKEGFWAVVQNRQTSTPLPPQKVSIEKLQKPAVVVTPPAQKLKSLVTSKIEIEYYQERSK